MENICSRWRKPKGRPSKKRKLAALKSAAWWNKNKSKDSVALSDGTFENDISHSTDSFAHCNKHSAMSTISEEKITRSEQKLHYFANDESDAKLQGSAYTIIHNSVWDDLLKNLACEQCGGKHLTVTSIGECGYSSKLQLNCSSCRFIYGTSFSSPRVTELKKFQINKNIVDAFLNIGKGHAALETFSMSLGMHAMDRKTFDKYVIKLAEESKETRKKILEEARVKVREEHKKFDPACNQDIINIGVSYDGTWHKRGHNSVYCVGCVIDILTGLIIDFEVISKYCHNCTKTAADLGENTAEFSVWYEGHKSSGLCEKNFEGSSGSMEAYAAELLWKRSVKTCKMQYTVLLSDGDSKTFSTLSKLNIYKQIKIVKEECINHVAKRLGTALRNKVKEWRTKGVCLGGRKKGNLTEDIIMKLTNYYRKAIKDNTPDINKMKTAIFASLHHSMSTNEKPQHLKCPSGPKSWCFHNRALALGSVIPDHSTMKTKLSEDVVSKILPVYQRLASDEILNRCTSGKTQNSNESVHSLLWKYCPKETFISKKRVELAAVSAISQFNMGCEASLKMKSANNETIRNPSLSVARKRDQRRLKQSVHRDTPNYKNAYRRRKSAKNKKERKQTQKEGVSYAAGSF